MHAEVTLLALYGRPVINLGLHVCSQSANYGWKRRLRWALLDRWEQLGMS